MVSFTPSFSRCSAATFSSRCLRQTIDFVLVRRCWCKLDLGERLVGKAGAHHKAGVAAFYRLEERYRGANDEIKQRLLIYRNDFRAARERVAVSGPVVDIGCGRGELLEVLGEDGFQAVGVDSNDIQLNAARRRAHPVSCLNYGAATATAAQDATLSGPQLELAQQALGQARMLINPTLGILGMATGKSSDHAGEAAVIFYVDASMNVSVPQTVSGVRTQVIPTTAQAFTAGIHPSGHEVARAGNSDCRGVQPGL